MNKHRTLLGMVMLLVALSGGTIQAFVAAPRIMGAAIIAVEPNGPAAQVGLEVGDVIVAVNSQPLRTAVDFNKHLGQNMRVTLLVRDSRTNRYVPVQVMPVNGMIGIRFSMTAVPERVIPQPPMQLPKQ